MSHPSNSAMMEMKMMMEMEMDVRMTTMMVMMTVAMLTFCPTLCAIRISFTWWFFLFNLFFPGLWFFKFQIFFYIFHFYLFFILIIYHVTLVVMANVSNSFVSAAISYKLGPANHHQHCYHKSQRPNNIKNNRKYSDFILDQNWDHFYFS